MHAAPYSPSGHSASPHFTAPTRGILCQTPLTIQAQLCAIISPKYEATLEWLPTIIGIPLRIFGVSCLCKSLPKSGSLVPRKEGIILHIGGWSFFKCLKYLEIFQEPNRARSLHTIKMDEFVDVSPELTSFPIDKLLIC